MARKAVDLKAAKAAKQKKIAVVGAVLLIVLLVVQVPRTMKMLGGGEAVDDAAVPVAPAAEEPVSLAPPTLDGGTPAPADGAEAVVSATAVEGKLVSFERFESKDPFAAQILPGDGSGSGAGPAAPEPAAEGPGGALPPELEVVGRDQAPATLTRADIEVNGTVETIQVLAEFPAAQPVFVLAAVAKNSVKVGIAGGSLANGDATVTIRKGESLSLVNTADGTRYRLRLVSVS